MNRPPLKTRLVGHPLVTGPLSIAAAWSGYACWQNTDVLPGTICLMVLAGWSLNANGVMVRYQSWKRAWDGMAPSHAPRHSSAWRPWAGAAMIAATFFYVTAHANQPGYAFAQGWMVIGLSLATILWLGKRLRRGRTKGNRNDLATVVIRRPLLPVPSVEEAYRRLPAYCRQLLERGR